MKYELVFYVLFSTRFCYDVELEDNCSLTWEKIRGEMLDSPGLRGCHTRVVAYVVGSMYRLHHATSF